MLLTVGLINVVYLYQVYMALYFLNDVDDRWMDEKSNNYIKIAILKSEQMGKLINRIPGSRL